MRRAAFVILVGLIGCGDGKGAVGPKGPGQTPAAPVGVDPAPPAPLVAPGLRLPTTFAVGSYAATLTIDPAQPTFGGAIEIAGELAEPQAVIWLHAEKLAIDRAVATTAAGEVPLEAITGVAPGRLALRAARPLPAGRLVIAIDYRGELDPLDTAGSFRQQVGNDWYVFTQHESIYARRTFPCIDEPSVKVPWTLTLVVPSGATAVANMPAVTDQVAGATRTVRFAATPPLPSYLVAFGVGPFDIVPAGTSAGGAPIRIIALRGRGADAAFAAAVTPKILAALEAWFGTPYPYAKLDSMAIPQTVGFGAMENPGLITYRESLILVPAGASKQREYRYGRVAAHEIAHQWFGDLVTPAWWDDLWLNESFASWLPDKVVGLVDPAWDLPVDTVDARSRSLDSDSLVTARRIRQPIETEDDIVTAFDGITYGKGAAVLRMFERQVGAEAFQRGVRAYLARHAHGNATAADFLGAIAAEAPDADVVASFGSFLDQAGAPRIAATLACDGAGVQVRLAQRRHVPLGAAVPTTTPAWKLPVCVKAGTGVKAVTACTRLDGGEGAVTLPPGCPAWVWPNAFGVGYYRSGLTVAQWRTITGPGWVGLEPRERMAAARDLVAAVEAGDVGLDVALALVPKLAAEGAPGLVLAAELLGGARSMVPAASRARFARWVRKQLGPAAKATGLVPKPGDGLAAERIRDDVVPLVADLGEPALRKAAIAAAGPGWRSLRDDARGAVAWIAVRAEPSLHAAMVAAFRAETERPVRADLAFALAGVTDRAALETSLALVLDPALDIRDTASILYDALANPETRDVAAAWGEAHLDELLARLPPQTAPGLVAVFASGCDARDAAARRAQAEAKLGGLRGARRRIDQAFERMSQCAARRAAMQPALDAWLATLK